MLAPHYLDVVGAGQLADEGGALTTTHPRPESDVVESGCAFVGLGALIWWVGLDEDVVGCGGVVGMGEGDVM